MRPIKLTLNKVFLILFLVLSAGQVAMAQDEVLTNESIKQLTEAGLSPSVIVQKIKKSKTNFDVTTPALADLKQAKVNPTVITAMMTAYDKDKMSNANPNDPKSLHPAGIYYFDKSDNSLKMMDEAIYEQNTGLGAKSAFGHGFVADDKKIDIDGLSAKLVVGDASPVFYMYTDPKNHTPAFPNTFTPNMLVLTAVDVHKKNRSITIGTYSLVGGTKSGVSGDKKNDFDYEKVGDNIYKIYFKSALSPGEYGFCVGKSFTKAGSTSTSANKVFDFGVH